MTPQTGSLQPTANTATSWRDFLSGLQGVGIDYLRQKVIDVERPSDDNNVPDQADLRYGLASPGPGGITLGAWAMVAVLVVVGVVVVARMK